MTVSHAAWKPGQVEPACRQPEDLAQHVGVRVAHRQRYKAFLQRRAGQHVLDGRRVDVWVLGRDGGASTMSLSAPPGSIEKGAMTDRSLSGRGASRLPVGRRLRVARPCRGWSAGGRSPRMSARVRPRC